ncbi:MULTISPECIES: transcription initiation factor IIB [Methanohalobium]|jgi:transcription initiation factor TFIIB|uniref:Transcription initiation factor IIB n=1 Tax=Methanohalobium evestigatum (strain ATCC BAA-1072 / DSM 3721 / NBRC 107634 / OCM 161 / Z-7303) TaxID=644295 RepID=D7E6N2_METEZ|nr:MULTISPECIES: transcription initiation factor IIB [Methanohalobium]ADI73254.1 Transcription factor TFIIB cyclin-related protein [Methanohalobium evestigatum Z-7303]
MVEVERERYSDTSEREKIREMIKARKEKEKEKEKSSETESSVTKCPECGSINLEQDYERAELVCSDCGLVVDAELVDEGPEWRAFDHDQRMKRSRVGAPMTYTIHDKGLSTMIDWRNRDSYGKSISSKNRAQLYRLRKWQRRIRVSNATERNLAFALSELDRMASALGLPRTVRETAAVVYRKAVDKNLIRGRSIEGVAAAALYAACRQCSVPRTLDEIGEVSRVSRKEIGRTYRFISRELSLKLMPTSPIDYVPRFCSGLKLKGEVQSKGVEILRQASEKELTSGRGPTGVAAAAIYIASILCGERRTQREVADVAGVTEVTIRNRYKELSEELDIEIIL